MSRKRTIYSGHASTKALESARTRQPTTSAPAVRTLTGAIVTGHFGLASGRPTHDPAARVHRRFRARIEGSKSVRELGIQHARPLSRCPKAMPEANRYTLVVRRSRASPHHPGPWSWEIYRDGKPLPARLREDRFKTEYTATLAGRVALRDFLAGLAGEESKP
jgi:hypothetical protein